MATEVGNAHPTGVAFPCTKGGASCIDITVSPRAYLHVVNLVLRDSMSFVVSRERAVASDLKLQRKRSERNSGNVNCSTRPVVA